MAGWHCFRLTGGADLRDSIEQCARDLPIRAGVLVACVGCLSRWRLRGADGRTLLEGAERAEIVSATGTVSGHGCHFHISLARENLAVIGGHLVRGCIVNTTAEVAIMEVEDTAFRRSFDEGTGYNELVIERNG